jgi:hypothetical protein
MRSAAPRGFPYTHPMVITGVVGSMALAALVQFEQIDYAQASLDELVRSITPRANGSHHDALLALRSMKDPRLAPLFSTLAQRPDPTAAIDGLLGEAELASPAGVTPLSLRLITDTPTRLAAMRAAVGLKLLPASAATELLGWDDIEPLDRAVLASVLLQAGEPIDAASIRPLLADERPAVAGLAAALLLQAGDTQGWEQFASRLAAAQPAERTAATQDVARAAEAYALKAVAPRLAELATAEGTTPNLRLLVMGTVLKLDPSHAQPLWQAATKDRSQVALLRAGLQLLVSIDTPPSGWGSSIRNGDPSMEALANALDAAATPDAAGLGDRLAAMVATGQRLMAEAALQRSRSMPDAAARPVLEALVDAGLKPDATIPFRSMALDAGQRLSVIDPAGMTARLVGAAEDRDGSELLVNAIYQSKDARAAELACAAREKLGRSAASMACMARARTTEPVDPAVLAQVGVAASGGSELSINFRTQAAWIFLSRSGQAERAIKAMTESSLTGTP